jgi:hypothetical protein
MMDTTWAKDKMSRLISEANKFDAPLHEQLKNVSAQIHQLHAQKAKHPQYAASVDITLKSLIALQDEMMVALSELNDVPASSEILSLEMQRGFVIGHMAPVNHLAKLMTTIQRIVDRIKIAENKTRKGPRFSVQMCFAGYYNASCGILLAPRIVRKIKNREQLYSDTTIAEHIFSRIIDIFSPYEDSSVHVDKIKTLGKVGVDNYIDVLESVNQYGTELTIAIPRKNRRSIITPDFAKKVLADISAVDISTEEITADIVIQALDISNGKHEIKYLLEGGKIQKATFENDLFEDIHRLFNKEIEGVFDVKHEKQSPSKVKEHWHLKSFMEIVYDEDNA